MKKLLLIVPALLIFLSVPAQTRKIGLLAHSGNIAAANTHSDGGFGLGPEMFKLSERQWDSIYKADSLRNDSILRATHPQGTGAKRQEPVKPKQPAPEMSMKTNSWLERSQPYFPVY